VAVSSYRGVKAVMGYKRRGLVPIGVEYVGISTRRGFVSIGDLF